MATTIGPARNRAGFDDGPTRHQHAVTRER